MIRWETLSHLTYLWPYCRVFSVFRFPSVAFTILRYAKQFPLLNHALIEGYSLIEFFYGISFQFHSINRRLAPFKRFTYDFCHLSDICLSITSEFSHQKHFKQWYNDIYIIASTTVKFYFRRSWNISSSLHKLNLTLVFVWIADCSWSSFHKFTSHQQQLT